MKIANISTIKNNLSKYIKYVQKGERIRILDRDQPVADLVPIELNKSGDKSEQQRFISLEGNGIVRRGSGNIPNDFFADEAIKSPKESGVLAALIEERRGSR